MALITGIPNFFTAPTAVADDFNNAALAIFTQIGGDTYSPALVRYVQLPGNLDLTNIAAKAFFRNTQKAEPYSFLTATVAAQVAGGVFTSTAFFGPFATDCLVTCINLCSKAGDYYISGGRFTVFLNNDLLTTFSMGGGGGSSVAGSAGEVSSVSTAIQIRVGDFLIIDPLNSTDIPPSPLLFSSADRVQGLDPPKVAPTSDLTISLFMISEHYVQFSP